MSKRIPISAKGALTLKEELKKMKTVDRPAIIEAIASAREHGDLKENAEYHAAKEKQSFIEGRIAQLEDTLARSEVVDIGSMDSATIKFGAKVTLIDDEDNKVTYKILSEYEADLAKGILSIASPLAQVLIGKSSSDYIELKTQKGMKGYEIVTIEYHDE